MQLWVLLFPLCGCTSRWVGVDPGEWRRKWAPLQERVFLRWADRSRLAGLHNGWQRIVSLRRRMGLQWGSLQRRTGLMRELGWWSPGGCNSAGEEPRVAMGGVGARSNMVQASGDETGCGVPGEGTAFLTNEYKGCGSLAAYFASPAGEPSHGVLPQGLPPAGGEASCVEDLDDPFSHDFFIEGVGDVGLACDSAYDHELGA